MPAVNVLIKPASSACNMRCSYCFYSKIYFAIYRYRINILISIDYTVYRIMRIRSSITTYIYVIFIIKCIRIISFSIK